MAKNNRQRIHRIQYTMRVDKDFRKKLGEICKDEGLAGACVIKRLVAAEHMARFGAE